MPGKESDGRLRIHNNYFQAGASTDLKLGVANSYYFSQCLDNRTFPSQLSVYPAPRTIATNLTGLITAMDQDLNGIRWGVASDGSIYSIDTNNNLVRKAQMTEAGSAGILYNQVTDQLYVPGQQTVSMYGKLTTANSPAVPRIGQFAQSASTANGVVNLFNSNDGFFDGSARNNAQSIGIGITSGNQVTTNTTATYTTPLALNENVGSYCYFAPDIEPFYSIQVYVMAKGTGDWTLTLHDSLNNQLAAVTVTNANLTNNAYNEFKFSGPIRALVNASQTGNSATYHWHITSTKTDGTVGTINSGDLSSADFLLFAYRLIAPNNGWHPTALFTGGGVPLLCIGNGQYLSTYNFGNDSNPTNSQWQRHNLTFKQGYEVCGLTTWSQYLVIAVERRSTNANRNVQDGALYMWDGTTNAPSIFVDVPMGAPYGIYTHNNVVYFACAGSLYAYSGGQSVIKVRKLAYQNTDYLNAVDSTIMNPNMMTSRYNILEIGYPSSTTNTSVTYGIWSWGTSELTFPNSYNLSYTLANGYTANTGTLALKMGCVYNFVDNMYISWQYTDAGGVTHYGLDLLDNFSTSATNFNWQSLIWDGGVSYKVKLATRVKVSCRALPTGATLQAGYSIDGGAWVWSPAVTTGAHGVTIDINKRFHEIQYGLQGTTAGTSTPPAIIGITLDVDPLTAENNLVAEQ